MIKKIIFSSGLLIINMIASQAMANCNNAGGWSRVRNLVATLQGNTVCSSAGQGTQEEHHSNGDLWDYKKGDGDPVDPRRQLGTWTVSNDGTPNAIISYDYTAFGNETSGPYRVFINGNSLDFCAPTGNSSVGTFTLKPGINVGC